MKSLEILFIILLFVVCLSCKSQGAKTKKVDKMRDATDTKMYRVYSKDSVTVTVYYVTGKDTVVTSSVNPDFQGGQENK